MPRATAANYELAPDQLAQALKGLVSASQPTMIWAPPGVGKSDVARQVAADLGMHYIDVRALLLDPVDLRGIPWRDSRTDDNGGVEHMTRWAVPSFLPPSISDEAFLLNLEERPNAPPMVQAALYQLCLDRAIGEYTLPPGARIIACGNRETDRGNTFKMLTPLASRFVHLYTRVDVGAWTDWALDANLNPAVIFFIKYRNELLMQFDPKSKEKAFPCPRTWSFVGRLVDAGLKGQSEVDLALLRGTVGEGAAIEFAAFLEVANQLPMPETVFNDPLGVDIPKNVSALLMLCAGVCGQAEADKMDALVAFAKRDDMRPEIGKFLVDSAIKFHPDSRHTQAWLRWEQHESKL